MHRRLTMAALAKIGSTQSCELLRKAYDGKVEIKKPTPEEGDEPQGMISFQPNQDGMERGSDAAQAARCLADLGENAIR